MKRFWKNLEIKLPLGQVKVLPSQSQFFYVHFKVQKSHPDCFYPDCIVRKIMES